MRMVMAVAVAMLAFTACNNDDDMTAESDAAPWHVQVPIEICMTNPGTTRALDGNSTTRTIGDNEVGDPGEDDKLAPPKHLYLFTWIEGRTSTDDNAPVQHYFIYDERKNIEAEAWEYTGTPHDQSSRYKYARMIGLTFTVAPQVGHYTMGDTFGRVYAIASDVDLSSDGIAEADRMSTKAKAVYDALKPAGAEAFALGKSLSINRTSGGKTIEQRIEEIALSTAASSGGSNSDGSWTQAELAALYSTPLGDNSQDLQSVENGRFKKINDDEEDKLVLGEVRLYHCAAKYDFTWQVDSVLRSTVKMKSITVTNLPTTCKVFEPTNNPTGTNNILLASSTAADNPADTIDIGSQWTGRAYCYGLQNPTVGANTGAMTYTATFTGHDNVNGSLTPATKNPVFTGWYRVVAKVK